MNRRPIRLVSPIDWSTLPQVPLERLERGRDLAAQWPELGPVVLVRHRSRPVLELELLERRERTIPLFEQPETAPLVVVELVEVVGFWLGLTDEWERDRDHAGDGECCSEHERQGQGVAGMPTSDARATSRRCSRRSGHSVMSEPMRKTSPASQMRLTSGFTKTRK